MSSKRPGEEQQEADLSPKKTTRPADYPDTIGYAVARNLKFRSYIAASYWLEQGCPRLDFLTSIGLRSLANVKWNVTNPSLVREFIANYNLKNNTTVLRGQVVTCTPKLISESFNLPCEGAPLLKRSSSDDQILKFFKEGALQKDLGYRHDMLLDASLAPIFSLVSEVVQLRVSSGYSSRNLVETVVQALQGVKVNWSEYIFHSLFKELRKIKQQRTQGTIVFGAGPLITHMFGHLGDDPNEPLVEVKSPVPMAFLEAKKESTLLELTVFNHVDLKETVSLPDTQCIENHIDGTQSPQENSVQAIDLNTSVESSKTKLVSLLSEATQVARELYSEEDLHRYTQAQVKQQRVTRERLQEELNQERTHREFLEAELKTTQGRLIHLEESFDVLDKMKRELEQSFRTILVEHQENLSRLVRISDEVDAKIQVVQSNFRELHKQVESATSSQQEQMGLTHKLEDLQRAIILLKTELAAKEMTYDECTLEAAKKCTREEYTKLVDTITDLQERLEQYQAKQDENDGFMIVSTLN